MSRALARRKLSAAEKKASRARPHALKKQYDCDWRKTLAEARYFLSVGILERTDPMKLIKYGFHKGWGCGWQSQEDRRERAYDELRKPDKAGSKKAIDRARRSNLPSDRFLWQMADAAKAARGARKRGDTLKRDAEVKREKWLPFAQQEYARLTSERPNLSRESTSKLVVKRVLGELNIKVSPKSILRHVQQPRKK